MHKNFLKTAFIIGAIGVVLGAFGAHALKKIFSAENLATYETAVRYQLYHVFALAMTGMLYKEFNNKFVLLAGKLFIAGIVLFSGSLYVLCYCKANGLENLYWLGAVTPFGGLSFILGWGILAKGIY